jgi:regulator of replication initiation timing
VNYQLERLQQKGCIVRNSRTSRAITLTEKAYTLLDVGEIIKEVPSIPDDLLQEVRRLRQENVRLRRIVDQGNVAERLQVQKEQLEYKHRYQMEKLEQERDRLIDHLVRLQMSSPSRSSVSD